jgi:hypothetical protein
VTSCVIGYVDYEILEAGEAGLGAFALRKFKKNEKIFVERPLLYGNACCEKIIVERPLLYGNACRAAEPVISGSAQAAVDALLPLGGSIQAKMMRNGMGISDLMSMPVRGNETPALFVTMSRVSLSCWATFFRHPEPVRPLGGKVS